MDRADIASPRTTALTPRTLHQLIAVRATSLIQANIPETVGLVEVRGVLGQLGQARGNWHYGVRLAHEGVEIAADIHTGAADVARRAIGQMVSVIGVLSPRVSPAGLVEIRLQASEIRTNQAVANDEQTELPGMVTVARLKTLPCDRHAFPVVAGRQLVVALVQSSSAHAQVSHDCRSELNRVADHVRVVPMPVNILDPAGIAKAIEKADADIVMVIRGGGDERQFDVFDDQRVVAAMAAKRAYRVVGLGHSGNRTALDFVVECSARTPAQAGGHVRERVEAQVNARREDQNAHLALAHRHPPATMDGKTSHLPIWAWLAILAAFLLGVFLR